MKYALIAIAVIVFAASAYFLSYGHFLLRADISEIQDISKIRSEYDSASFEYVFRPAVIISILAVVLIILVSSEVFNNDLPLFFNEKPEKMTTEKILIIFIILISLSAYLFSVESSTSSIGTIALIVSAYFVLSFLNTKEHVRSHGLYTASIIAAAIFLAVVSTSVFTDNLPFVKPYFMSYKINVIGLEYYSLLNIAALSLTLGLSLSYFLENLLTEEDSDY